MFLISLDFILCLTMIFYWDTSKGLNSLMTWFTSKKTWKEQEWEKERKWESELEKVREQEREIERKWEGEREWEWE